MEISDTIESESSDKNEQTPGHSKSRWFGRHEIEAADGSKIKVFYCLNSYSCSNYEKLDIKITPDSERAAINRINNNLKMYTEDKRYKLNLDPINNSIIFINK